MVEKIPFPFELIIYIPSDFITISIKLSLSITILSTVEALIFISLWNLIILLLAPVKEILKSWNKTLEKPILPIICVSINNGLLEVEILSGNPSKLPFICSCLVRLLTKQSENKTYKWQPKL